MFHFVDGGADEFGIVESVAVMYIVRQVLFHLLHAFIYGIGDIDMIGTRLRHDDYADHRHTVHLHVTFDVGCSKFGPTDVAETDNLVPFVFHNQIVEHLGRVHQSHGTDVQFYGISFYATRWQFDIFIVHCIFDVHRRDTVAGHFDGVEPQTHGIFFLSPNGNTTYVGNRL